MHFNGDRQSADSDHVVDNHSHRILGDFVIMRHSGVCKHGVSGQVFCTQTFVVVGQVHVRKLEQKYAAAA